VTALVARWNPSAPSFTIIIAPLLDSQRWGVDDGVLHNTAEDAKGFTRRSSQRRPVPEQPWNARSSVSCDNNARLSQEECPVQTATLWTVGDRSYSLVLCTGQMKTQIDFPHLVSLVRSTGRYSVSREYENGSCYAYHIIHVLYLSRPGSVDWRKHGNRKQET